MTGDAGKSGAAAPGPLVEIGQPEERRVRSALIDAPDATTNGRTQ